MEWISVKDRLPEQRESMFARYKGTSNWNNAMFEKTSNTVIVVLEEDNHNKIVTTGHLVDGRWATSIHLKSRNVTHWMEFPEPPIDVEG